MVKKSGKDYMSMAGHKFTGYKFTGHMHKFNLNSLSAIAMYEVGVIFSILLVTYTMPMTVYKFSSSLFGKIIIILSIIYASYYNIKYGVVLAVLFIGISELGKLEEGFDDMKTEEEKGMDDKAKAMDDKAMDDKAMDDKTMDDKKKDDMKKAMSNEMANEMANDDKDKM
jgi:hypothetical protein